MGAARSAAEARVAVASRTDRGVHAVGNALTLTSGLGGPALLRALNGISPEVFFTHARPVPDDFAPRQARRRWYRYFELPHPGGIDGYRRVAGRLVGEVDARSFGRGVPADRPSRRRVDRIEVAEAGRWWTIDVEAPAFAWGMVRKIVAALRAVADGRLREAAVLEAARGERRLALPMAEPGGLVLWNVDFGEPWTFASPRMTRAQRVRLSAAQASALQREAFLGAMRSALGGQDGPPPG